MRLLLIEDNSKIVDIFDDFTNRRGFSLLVASSVSDALAIINDDKIEFDLAVCDLKIPSENGGVDLETTHGLDVIRALGEVCPGVPVIVLSAFGRVDDFAFMLLAARQCDIYGTGTPVPMLQYAKKSTTISVALEAVLFAESQLNELAEIEVWNGGSIPEYQKRALAIFARKRGGRLIEYRTLTGGLSGAHTGLVMVRDSNGAVVAHVVAKTTRLDRAVEEKDRYMQCIAGRLGAGVYADLSDEVLSGCARSAGLFYSVAATYNKDLFAMLLADEVTAAAAVTVLRDNLSPWVSGIPQTKKTWLDIRRELISDEKYDEVKALYSIIEVPEEKAIQAVWTTQHGDLHGANVLVDATGRPVLIDFGRAGHVTSVLDPITLELSVLFHPDSSLRDSPWPSVEQLRNWDNVEAYLIDCPYPNYVRACRDWAMGVRVAGRDFFATLNAYCLRNLQYKDTNIDRALSLQQFAASRLNDS